MSKRTTASCNEVHYEHFSSTMLLTVAHTFMRPSQALHDIVRTQRLK